MAETATQPAKPQPPQGREPPSGPSQPPRKRYTFQVLAGRHWQPGEVVDDTGRTVIRDIKYGPGCPAGDLVETEVELDKRFNDKRPGAPPKFRRLGEDGHIDLKSEELKAEKQKSVDARGALKSALERMPRNELVNWAEEQRLDLRGAVKREDVLRIVLSALGL